jgi:hypothetical protein
LIKTTAAPIRVGITEKTPSAGPKVATL